MFAALNTANGEVYGLCQQKHRHQEWLRFLRMIDKTILAGKEREPKAERKGRSAAEVKEAIHVGHSTGGGKVMRYLGRHSESRVAKAAPYQRGAAADGEDGSQPTRASQGSV